MGQQEFDSKRSSLEDLMNQPVQVVKTELPALAEALGVSPAELFRSLPEDFLARGKALDRGVVLEGCCTNDSW